MGNEKKEPYIPSKDRRELGYDSFCKLYPSCKYPSVFQPLLCNENLPRIINYFCIIGPSILYLKTQVHVIIVGGISQLA